MHPSLQRLIKVIVFTILILANVWVWSDIFRGCGSHANPFWQEGWYCRVQTIIRCDEEVFRYTRQTRFPSFFVPFSFNIGSVRRSLVCGKSAS